MAAVFCVNWGRLGYVYGGDLDRSDVVDLLAPKRPGGRFAALGRPSRCLLALAILQREAVVKAGRVPATVAGVADLGAALLPGELPDPLFDLASQEAVSLGLRRGSGVLQPMAGWWREAAAYFGKLDGVAVLQALSEGSDLGWCVRRATDGALLAVFPRFSEADRAAYGFGWSAACNGEALPWALVCSPLGGILSLPEFDRAALPAGHRMPKAAPKAPRVRDVLAYAGRADLRALGWL